MDYSFPNDKRYNSFVGYFKQKYGERFGLLVDIISDEDAAALQSTDEEISVALDGAIDAAINKILTQRKLNMA